MFENFILRTDFNKLSIKSGIMLMHPKKKKNNSKEKKGFEYIRSGYNFF